MYRISLFLFGICFGTLAVAGYTIQVGAFASTSNANQLSDELAGQGFRVMTERVGHPGGLTRVILGPYPTRRNAERRAEDLVAAGLGTPVLIQRREVRQPASPPSPRATEAGQVMLAANGDPQGLDDLFLDEPSAGESGPGAGGGEAGAADADGSGSLDSLFQAESAAPSGTAAAAPRVTGFYQNGLAYTYGADDHFSKFRNTLEVSLDRREAGFSWKASARAVFDPVYLEGDFYPDNVQQDQGAELTLRETYIDIPYGKWDFRLGRQQIVWGEMVGLFFADVVSAKDLRESVLQDFDFLRIPQWAARAEYFGDSFHAELIWLPYMTYDDIGEPGADFFPQPVAPPGVDVTVLAEDKPQGVDAMAYGARVNYLRNGWDFSLLYYTSMESSAAFERTIVTTPTPTFVYEPTHERIHQAGGTLAKDFRAFLLKGEAVYTHNKRFGVTRAGDADGLVDQNLLDYVLGLDWSLMDGTRINFQLYQRWFLDHDPDMVPEERETGASLLWSREFPRNLEPEVLLIHSLNRSDWLLQAKLSWEFARNWRSTAGLDVFHGEQTGLFGRYDQEDRVYTEIRYSF